MDFDDRITKTIVNDLLVGIHKLYIASLITYSLITDQSVAFPSHHLEYIVSHDHFKTISFLLLFLSNISQSNTALPSHNLGEKCPN